MNEYKQGALAGRNDNWRQNWNTRSENCPGPTVSTANPTRIDSTITI